MTIDEMFNKLDNKVRDTYIVTLKYKYDFEENYTIENNILEYDSMTDSYVWLNDWDEGQTDVEVLGYMILSDVDTQKTKEIGAYTEGYDEGYDRGYITGEAQADAWLVIQEHIDDTIDKIRAEIIELRSRQNVGVLECLDIIDKYRAESEE